VGDVAVDGVDEEAMREDAAVEEQVHIRVERDRRKRIFWIWGSIWIRRLRLSLLVVGKVRYYFMFGVRLNKELGLGHNNCKLEGR
jgi:hypothetical protein